MALKAKPEPKIQRGISLSRELYEAIHAHVEVHGGTWNETVERVLANAFLRSRDSQNRVENSRTSDDVATAFSEAS